MINYDDIEEIEGYPKIALGKSENLTGQVFGRLTPLYRTVNTGKSRIAKWVYKCSCGENSLTVTTSQSLKSGHTKSCGCYNKEIVREQCRKIGKQSNYKDYTKVDNPYYTFVEPKDNIKGQGRKWIIKCKKCGKEYIDFPSQIISDRRRKGNNPCECWKRQSKGVLKIKTILEENKISFVQEYSFADCLSPKGNKMKFDFFLSDYNLCIEYDGEQHFLPTDFHTGDQSNGQARLELQQQYDKIKTGYCKTKGIKLLRIPYTDYQNITFEK